MSKKDPFAKFPTEILCRILESCCDFTSLNGLQQMSPRVKGAFSGSPKNITKQVLRNCSLTLHGLHHYFSLMTSVRSTSFTPQALLEELATSKGDVVRPISLSTTHSLAAVQQTVTSAASIHLTACACLRHFTNRLESAKPRRPIVSDDNVVEWAGDRRLPPPEAGEVIHFDIDPPSWIETYRTHRCLWKLELFHQIHQAATSHWQWSTEELNCFVDDYLQWCQYSGGIEELQTISECVIDLCSLKPEILSYQAPYLVALPSPIDLTVQTCWPLPDVQGTQIHSNWGRSPGSVPFKSTVLSFFNCLRQGEKGRSYHPLWKVDFKAFRRLGIPLWDRWRCYQMRLMSSPRSTLSPQGNMVGGDSEKADWPPWITAYVWFSLAEEGDLII